MPEERRMGEFALAAQQDKAEDMEYGGEEVESIAIKVILEHEPLINPSMSGPVIVCSNDRCEGDFPRPDLWSSHVIRLINEEVDNGPIGVDS